MPTCMLPHEYERWRKGDKIERRRCPYDIPAHVSRSLYSENNNVSGNQTQGDDTMSEQVKIFNGYYTVTSPSGKHRTFRIRTIRQGQLEGKRVLELLTGPDNEESYKAFAFVYNDNIRVWRKHQDDDFFVKSAKMMYSLATEGQDSVYVTKLGMRLQLSKRCAKCNRRLTEPKSIELGIGPQCRGEQ